MFRFFPQPRENFHEFSQFIISMRKSWWILVRDETDMLFVNWTCHVRKSLSAVWYRLQAPYLDLCPLFYANPRDWFHNQFDKSCENVFIARRGHFNLLSHASVQMRYILTGDIGRQFNAFDTWHRKINKEQILCLKLSHVAYQLTTQTRRVKWIQGKLFPICYLNLP